VPLAILSAGAAKWLVGELAARENIEVAAQFNAVGATQETFLSGAICDVIILTQAKIAALAALGRVRSDSCTKLGTVQTGIAVRAGDPLPGISPAAVLRTTLLDAAEIHYPDPHKATAGIHFMKILDSLDIRETLEMHLRPHPNGATAMHALARAPVRAIGCTQIPEILNTPGVALAAPLAEPFALATVYSVAVSVNAAHIEAARNFIALLTGAGKHALREQAGFLT
jgi:molybdate transport system substrate-binding protein